MSEYVVIKLGGEVIASAYMPAIAADVAEMQARGERVVIVHGGGAQATDLQKKLGQTPKIVAGRRVTDADALEVIKMIVAGKMNVDVECSPLLGPQLMSAVKDVVAGKPLPKRILTEETVFPMSVAAQTLPTRKY